MKNQFARLVGAWLFLIVSIAFAEQEGMMHGDRWGGDWMEGYSGMGHYGGIWLPVLLVFVFAALVIWIVKKK